MGAVPRNASRLVMQYTAPVVHAVLRHRAVDPPDPALVPFPSAAIA